MYQKYQKNSQWIKTKGNKELTLNRSVNNCKEVDLSFLKRALTHMNKIPASESLHNAKARHLE